MPSIWYKGMPIKVQEDGLGQIDAYAVCEDLVDGQLGLWATFQKKNAEEAQTILHELARKEKDFLLSQSVFKRYCKFYPHSDITRALASSP